ncbi:B-cell receptor CD22-like isoform X2 [Paralichthys olivaceus]|uniref:B-cell receptor CD22-like isoform X2 n=1 Tax=Paralichthys olivaceus TaxID=8255 RepID=UPI00375365DF
MRAAATMSGTAAASGFVLLLLSVPVAQCENDWGVTCTPTKICAVRGSKVQIRCTYMHPPRINDHDVAVEQMFWFTNLQNSAPEDLRAVSEYAGRVQYHCGNNACTLTITDLRESDSAEYKFRFITNQPTGRFSGSPGVTLSVTGVQVLSKKLSNCRWEACSWSRVECKTSCSPTPSPSYIWYKNGQKTWGEESSYDKYFYSSDSISCAVRGHEDFPSAPVYAPKVPLLQLSQTGHMMKDSSVSLTCSSDANPPPAYAWYKNNQTLFNTGAQLVFSSIQFSDSGEFYCTAENELGKTASKHVVINVKYAPKVPSVSVSPSGEIMEGSSVTLTCSSDANPAANYTWYKEDEDSPRASGQNFTITNITAEHGGNYRCEAQNRRGRSDASLHVTVGAVWTSAVIGSAAAAFLAVTLLAVTLLSVFFLIRKKRNSHQSPDPGDRLDHSEQRLPNQSEEDCDLHYGSVHFMKTETDPVYSNVGSAEPSKHKEREEVVYASVNFNRSAPRTRGQDTAEDPFAFYSTVKKPSAV